MECACEDCVHMIYFRGDVGIRIVVGIYFFKWVVQPWFLQVMVLVVRLQK